MKTNKKAGLKQYIQTFSNLENQMPSTKQWNLNLFVDWWCLRDGVKLKPVVLSCAYGLRNNYMLHLVYCWRALARQLPILYNREKKAKSVGCKIGDLRSKFAFNIRGPLNVETCAVDYGCLWMHVELSIHFKRKERQDKGGEFLHLCR